MHLFRSVRPSHVLAIAALLCSAACGSSPASPTATVPFSQIDLRLGTGADAVAGRRLTVNYTGWLYDPSGANNKGAQFDTSIGKTPYSFILGAGQVIKGWDQGCVGMKVGGQRRLIIPPDQAYGSAGSGSIPGNATLVFDIDLLDVQ